jgi:hypothetical protein
MRLAVGAFVLAAGLVALWSLDRAPVETAVTEAQPVVTSVTIAPGNDELPAVVRRVLENGGALTPAPSSKAHALPPAVTRVLERETGVLLVPTTGGKG